MTYWLFNSIKSTLLGLIHYDKHLKIGYSASIKYCKFGLYNTIYNFVHLREVSLGDFTYISKNASISKTSIGKFCSIGPGCRIGLGKHPTNTFASTHPIFYSSLKQAQITFSEKDYFEEFEYISIGNDVWLGANVIVVDGINISDGAIIASGSVVTKDVPPYAIVAGIPAKIVKYRFDNNEIEKLLSLKWWDMDIEILKKNYEQFHDINIFLEQFFESK